MKISTDFSFCWRCNAMDEGTRETPVILGTMVVSEPLCEGHLQEVLAKCEYVHPGYWSAVERSSYGWQFEPLP